jgi:flagellar assembly protein FliH
MAAVKMNSSTKIPGGPAQKFKFDVDFELEEERLRLEMLRQEEAARHALENPVQIITYSEDELRAAREESFQLGYEQGLADAKKGIEQAIADLTDQALFKMEGLLNQEEKRWENVQRVAITTTMATLKKFWPQMMQHMGVQLVEDTIRQSLEVNNEEARIVVRVHDTLLDHVVARLPQLKEQQAFAGKVIILSDDHIAAGDCKVEWADGGLERLSRTLSQQLDGAFNRILAHLSNEKANTSSNTERTSS